MMEIKAENINYIISKTSQYGFHTIQSAFDAIPDSSFNHYTLLVKKGVYHEKLELLKKNASILMIGEFMDSTILDFNDFSGKVVGSDTLTTHNSYTFRINCDGFVLQNITVQNSAGRVGQAVAVEINSDKVAFYNCRFIGDQDTFYANGNGRIYVKDCYIEGTTDFIFGKSTVFFEHCQIYCKKNSYITAASTPQECSFGFVFYQCIIMADTTVKEVYLGRPWRDFARVVFLQCTLSACILPEGWHNWSKPWREKTAFFAEYNNMGQGADYSKRVNWSHQLSQQEAEEYSITAVFSKNSCVNSFIEDWEPYKSNNKKP